jgi:hypothetical protein
MGAEILKTCSICNIEMSIDLFNKRRNPSGNIAPVWACRDCANNKNKLWQRSRDKQGLKRRRYTLDPFPEGQMNIITIDRPEIGPYGGYIKCDECEETYIMTNYYYRKDTNVYRTVCKGCHAEKRRKQYIVDSEIVLARNKIYRETNKDKINEHRKRTKYVYKKRYTSLKSQAKNRGLEVGLNFEEYEKIAKNPCHYCNDEFGEATRAGGGLDRLDNSIGYMKGNVVSCCRICNSLKLNIFTEQETLIAVKAILDYRRVNP